ncbi:MAG TPA: hypothetical protein PLL69_06855 [Gemmatimonadales bacterium]|nr:hypothetical protein [Gemmatimonadales bacterium]
MRQYTLLAAALVFAAACGDDPPTGPGTGMTAQMRADVAQSSGEAIAQHTEAMVRSEATASAALFAFAGDPSQGDCTISLGTFLCINSLGALDGETEIVFRDGGGIQQQDYDAETTASATVETEWDGTIQRSDLVIDLSASGDFAVTGMTGAEASRTWNGTAATSVSNAVHAGTRSYEWTATSNWSSVVVAASGDEPRWPLSGTVNANLQLEATEGPDEGRTASTTVQVTFNGTATVPLRVGGTEYTLDLSTRSVTEN